MDIWTCAEDRAGRAAEQQGEEIARGSCMYVQLIRAAHELQCPRIVERMMGGLDGLGFHTVMQLSIAVLLWRHLASTLMAALEDVGG